MPHSPIPESKSETEANRDRTDEPAPASVGLPFWALQVSQSPLPVGWIVGLCNRTRDERLEQRLQEFIQLLRR